MHAPRETLALASVVLVAAACATYPERMADALEDFERGRFESAAAAFADPERVPSRFLSAAETGTVALAMGDWERALQELGRAALEAEALEERALAGVESLGEELATWAWNETARDYLGEGFERVYLHAGLALVFLTRGLLDEVFVETRRANQLLEAEERLYEADYAAGGWGHLLSGVTYELLGEPDQALIDYERMVTKGVGLALAGPELVRLARVLGRPEQLQRWSERFGPGPELVGDEASVVLLAGVGLAPYKVEHRLVVPTHDGVLAVAGATFRDRPQPIERLRLAADSGAVDSVVVEDVGAVAARNLEDRQGWLLARSAIRGVAKREVTQALEREHGAAGFLAGTLFTLFSERADCRSWTTLPDTWQASRLLVPPGAHELTLEALRGGVRTGEAVALGSFALEPGETMLLVVRTLGSRIHAYPVGGVPVEPNAPTSP